jgi:hypothetical protein
MKTWFGKDCEYLMGQWESCDILACAGDKKQLNNLRETTPPNLVFCDHPNNKNDHEGNCNEEMCPIYVKDLLE